MIANLLNTLTGLWLAYAAIFPVPGASRERLILAAAGATILLALWARRTDASPWQSTTSVAVGALLALLIGLHQIIALPSVLLFWCVLSAGLVSAVLSLWAALYRPDPAAAPAD